MTYSAGDRVRTTAEFSELFPWTRDPLDDRPLAGVVCSYDAERQHAIVQFDGRHGLSSISVSLIEPETIH